MSTFVGIPHFSNSLWVAMETMHCHIAHTIFRTPSFRIQGSQWTIWHPWKLSWVGVVQGNLNWMLGYLFIKICPRIKIRPDWQTDRQTDRQADSQPASKPASQINADTDTHYLNIVGRSLYKNNFLDSEQ